MDKAAGDVRRSGMRCSSAAATDLRIGVIGGGTTLMDAIAVSATVQT